MPLQSNLVIHCCVAMCSGGNALTSFRLKPNESGGKMYVNLFLDDLACVCLSVVPFKCGVVTWFICLLFWFSFFDGTKVPKPSVLHVERGWRHVCGGRIALWQCGQRFVFCGVGIGRAVRRFAGRGGITRLPTAGIIK